jgi:cell division septation protein DedD
MKLKAKRDPGNYLMTLISKPITVLWLGGVLFLIVASLIPQAGLSEIDSGFGKDKIARVIIFALLAFYPAAFFPSIRMGLITSTSIAPLGFVLELFQRYVPGRNFSPGDMIANNVGAVAGILLALAIRFFFRTGRWKQRAKANGPDTRSMAMEDEVTKTPKKSWKSKLIILSLLLVMGYIAWVIFLENKPGPPLPTPTEPSPAKTAIKEEAQKTTGPDHAIKNHPEPGNSETTLPKTRVSGNDPPLVPPPSQGRDPQQEAPPLPEPENTVKAETAAIPDLLETSNLTASQPPPNAIAEPELIPAPELTQVPDAMQDLTPPFVETELQASPVESPPEKTSLMDQGEKGSHEPAVPPEIETTPEQDAEPPAPAASANLKFSLRLGAFLEKENAEGLVSNLMEKGYKPYIFEATDAKNRTWYAVHLSDHENLDAAATAAEIFRNKEETAIIIVHKDSLKPVKDALKK